MDNKFIHKKRPVFCLLTDFGLMDPYVGQLKARLLSIIPNAQLLDISHEIEPHNILQASFFLVSSWPYIPAGSITIVVVDPGVGTERDILVLEKDKKIVITPDNGLIYPLLEKYTSASEIYIVNKANISKYLNIDPSTTFHGRDIFAPLGACLCEDRDLDKLISKTDKQKIKKIIFPQVDIRQRSIKSHVIHIDRFGNCILGIESRFKQIFSQGEIYLTPLNQGVYLVSTYAQIPKNKIGLLDGSQGYMELALNQENLAQKFNIKIGDTLILQRSF